MSAYIIRRRKLGRTSCRELSRFSRQGIRAFRNDQRIPEGADVVFRWGCTSNVGNAGVIVNSAEAIHRVSDKKAFRQLLAQMQTHWPVYHDEAPPRGFDFGAGSLVIRPATHHQGRHLYIARSGQELANILRLPVMIQRGWYAAPKVDKVAEYRVFVVSGRCVCVAKKHPANPQAVAWNVAQGGRFENVRWDEWPLKAVRVSLEAFALSGLDFGGVDVMVDAEGGCYVLEINSAPSLTSPYRQSCFAKAFDYIVQHGKQEIPLQAAKGNWRKFIHPAITENVGVR